MKKILILGGTSFIGRVLVEKLLNYQEKLNITLFNRGKTNPNLFPQINKIVGDRETQDIEKTFDTKWDIIFDISSYYPNSLENIIKNIQTDKYVYISTVSVYDTKIISNLNEDTQTFNCLDSQKKDKSIETYGIRKAESERILLKSSLNKVILRPSLVYGKFDPTDRLYYWIYHIYKQEKIIFPKNCLNSLINFTYIKDLVKTIVFTGFNQMKYDVYNINTHKEIKMKDIIEIISNKLSKKIELELIEDKLLDEEKIISWSDIILAIPNDFYFDNSRILKEINFEFESLESSIENTIYYYKNLNFPECKVGMSISKENNIISLL